MTGIKYLIRDKKPRFYKPYVKAMWNKNLGIIYSVLPLTIAQLKDWLKFRWCIKKIG